MLERIRKSRRDEGFTLIELLIVIVILGILAAIVVFAIGSTRSDSVKSSCKTNYKQVELSAEAVNTKTGSYPAGAVVATTASNPLVAGGVANNGALMKTFPTSNDYQLEYSGASGGGSYNIYVYKSGVTPAADGTGAVTGTGVAACDNL